MQKYFMFFLLSGLLVAGIALAQNGEETGVDALDPAETVTAADLEVEDPGTLPTSRFYFFKEWGRGIRSFFTFDPVKKTELELRFANEKIAEAKKVQETNPHDERAIKKAVENYQKSQERLRLRFESLKETSQNPNIDRLLDQLTEKTVRHEKVLEEIAAKEKDVAGVDELIQKAKEKIEESAAAGAAKDEPRKFTARLEKSFIESKGSELKHVRSLEILERISRKAPEGFQDSLEKLREEFSERAREDIEEVLKTQTSKELQEALEDLPGDVERRLHIIEELQEKAKKQVEDALKNAAKGIEKAVKAEKRIAQKAAEQIEDAAERIEKLEKEMGELPSVPENVLNLAATAKEHLENARKAFEEGKFGEAFGQARSAESASRNALRILEELEEEEEGGEDVRAEFQEDLDELEMKIQKHEALVQGMGFTLEENPEVFKLLEQSKQHLGFARDSLAKDDFEGTKLHIGHVKGFLREIAKAVELHQRQPEKLKESKEKLQEKVCIQVFDPVCGVDGKTYSNRCVAEQQNRIKVAHEGECEEKITPEPLQKSSGESTADQGRTVSRVLEADDSGFYPSSEIRVPKGARITLEFKVRSQGVYFGGLDFRSDKFKSQTGKPGEAVKVEFIADESFAFTSWWPASERLKATGRVIVE